MSNLIYKRMISIDDEDIYKIKLIHQIPQISQYISISDNYFHYVTSTKNVYFYKIYYDDKLVGTTHIEKQQNILYMDILVFPEFQGNGIGTKIVTDIQNDIFKLGYDKIEVSIDEKNIPSIRLFEKTGFVFVSKEDELKNYVYIKK